MLIFGLCSTSDDQPGWSMDSNTICHPSPAKKIKYSFLDYNQLLMIGRAGWWTRTSSANPGWAIRAMKDDRNVAKVPLSHQTMKCSLLDYTQLLMIGRAGQWTWTPSTTLSSQKNKILIFGLQSTSDDWPSWLMDSNLIRQPSPAKEIKCSFLDYIQLLMISRAGPWTQTPSVTTLQPKK